MGPGKWGYEMPEMTEYADGVPSWADLATPDLEGSIRFYCELFGWETDDQGEEANNYTITLKDGKQVAGLMAAETSPLAASSTDPAHWQTFVNVTSLDDTLPKVEAAGGKMVYGPIDAMTAGRAGMFADPTGAAIGAWQPRDHIGAQLVNEPGAMIWNELATSNLSKVKSFYSQVFGWDWAGSDDYAEVQVDGRSTAGLMPRPEMIPAEVPDHWLVYFGSANVDADVDKAKVLGAKVALEPTDIPQGRMAVVIDPQGAAFGLFKA